MPSCSDPSRKTRVLIVDDSALMRQLLERVFKSDPTLEVVGTAPDPVRAWDLIAQRSPDVITLDVEMPRMDGLAFLEKLMRARPMPVLMVSSLTDRGADTTLKALELGAVDFVTKPKIDISRGVVELADQLVYKVKAAARARVSGRRLPPSPAALKPVASTPRLTALPRTTETVVAIGASTGGTEALRTVLTALPPDAPGIVIVQHMPEAFTRAFASRLDGLCRINVREARDGDRVLSGHALIAPGGTHHMELVRSGACYAVKLLDAPPLNHHRPAVDVLFRSCARVAGSNAVAAILTGMGADGALGMREMHAAGARTIAQDEASCLVYGMPREAVAAGGVDCVLPLDRIADGLLRLARREARARSA